MPHFIKNENAYFIGKQYIFSKIIFSQFAKMENPKYVGPMEHEIAYFFSETPEHELASSLDTELLVCGYAEEKSDLESFHPFRTDPFFRLYFPIRGKIRASGCDGATVIEPGRSYLFPAQVPFRFMFLGGFTHNWVHFRSRTLLRMPEFRKLMSVSNRQEAPVLWEKFLACAQDQHTLKDALEANQLLHELLLPFLEKTGSVGSRRPRELERFQCVLDYAAKHLEEPIEIPQLATLCNLNRNDFSREFRRVFGIPPKQYLTQLRMERAKEQLLTTDETVKEIAAHCGYDNEYFFYRIFKKYARISPAEYRRQIRRW